MPTIKLNKYFFNLAYFLMLCYYFECLKVFPDLSNYRVGLFQLTKDVKDDSPLEDAFRLSFFGDQSSLFLNALRTNGYTVKDFRIIQEHILLDLFFPFLKQKKSFYNEIKNSINSLDSLEVTPEYEESKIYFQSKKDFMLKAVDSHLNKFKKSKSSVRLYDKSHNIKVKN